MFAEDNVCPASGLKNWYRLCDIGSGDPNEVFECVRITKAIVTETVHVYGASYIDIVDEGRRNVFVTFNPGDNVVLESVQMTRKEYMVLPKKK